MTDEELKGLITHLAFYAGWPMSRVLHHANDLVDDGLMSADDFETSPSSTQLASSAKATLTS